MNYRRGISHCLILLLISCSSPPVAAKGTYAGRYFSASKQVDLSFSVDNANRVKRVTFNGRDIGPKDHEWRFVEIYGKRGEFLEILFTTNGGKYNNLIRLFMVKDRDSVALCSGYYLKYSCDLGNSTKLKILEKTALAVTHRPQ